MAKTFQPCSVENCNKDASRSASGRAGLCRAHFNRLRKYGSPTGGPAFRHEPEQYLRNVVFSYDGDECLPWPFGRDSDGYGAVYLNGTQRIVSRVVCEMMHGSPPSPRHQAAHLCGNGRGGCVAPRHLAWKTPRENQADKIAHGTLPAGDRHGMAKLTNVEAKEVIRLKGILPRATIAKMFGISPVTVGDIHRGKTWRAVR